VVEQLPDRDGLLVVGNVREVLREGIVEPELPLLDEPQDRRRRDLLGRRGDLEERLRRVRPAGVVGVAVALRENGLSVARDEHGAPVAAAGRPLDHGVELATELSFDDGLAGGRDCGERQEDRYEERRAHDGLPFQ
jgi:hypothetical protein